MKKAILVFICILAAVCGFAQDAVGISHTLPATISPGQTFEVDFTINKGNVGGFAKFQMDLPFGFNAGNIDSKGGNFTYENQRVKIVWVSVPGEPSFTFRFKITVPSNAVNSCSVTSKFFYLENNVKKEVEMASYTMKIDGTGSGAVSSTSTPTVAATPTVASTPTVETTPVISTPTVTPTETVSTTSTYTQEPVSTPTVAATPTVDNTPPTREVVTSNPTITPESTTSAAKTSSTTSSSSSAGMTYKVQIGAFSSSPSRSKFPGVSVAIVEEGGFYKALSGNFTSMEQAQKHKSDLAAKGYQGFIVFYQNGQRVGIQK